MEQPLLTHDIGDQGASVASSTSQNGHACGGFVARHLGTDQQRAFFLITLASVFALSQIRYAPPSSSSEVSANVLGIDYAANLLSAIAMVVGNFLYYQALHPSRLLLNAGYDGGRTMDRPASFWKRHFGTLLLVASQLQMLSVGIYVVGGTVEVIMVDFSIAEAAGLWAAVLTTDDELGWMNIISGVLACWALYVLNRTTYPGMLTRPRSEVADLVRSPRVERCIGLRRARWLEVHLLNDNLVTGWILAVATSLWLLSAVFSGEWLDVLQPALYCAGGLFFLRFAMNDGTMLDPVLFGCHRSSSLPVNHPLGQAFNAPFTEGLDVGSTLDAARALVELPWIPDPSWTCPPPSGASLYNLECDGISGVKVEMDVGLQAFALAALLRSSEFRKQDASVERTEVVTTLSPDADVVHSEYCASPPMPKSDRVFVSAAKESLAGDMIVAEWPVDLPCYPPQLRSRVVREHSCTVFILTPIGPAATRLVACVITCVASWLPRVLVQDEMKKAAPELCELQRLPGSHDGQELICAVQREIWSATRKEMTPCLWNLFQSVAPGIATLRVPALCRFAPPLQAVATLQNPLENMEVTAPETAAAMVLGIASASHAWREIKLGLCSNKRHGATRLWKHAELTGAVQASVEVAAVHPMALALILQSPEFKRQSDSSITDLQEVRRVSDVHSIYYQRSRLGGPFKDRDSTYACAVLDIGSELVYVIEWPMELNEFPEIHGVRRSRSCILYEIRGGSRGGSVQLTVTAVVNLAGFLGSRWLRPVNDRNVAEGMFSGLEGLSVFFQTPDGAAAKAQVHKEAMRGICDELRRELSATQLGFMKAYSDVFRAEAAIQVIDSDE